MTCKGVQCPQQQEQKLGHHKNEWFYSIHDSLHGLHDKFSSVNKTIQKFNKITAEPALKATSI